MPAHSRRAMRVLVWDGNAAQLTLLNQALMAAFILILLVTCMRPSELLASRKKDLVPLPLLPCWSVVIAGARIQRVLGFRTLQDVQKRVQWRAFSSAARYGRSSRLAADCHSLLLSRSETSWKLARRAEALLVGRL